MPSTPAALFRSSSFKAAETSSRVMSALKKSKGCLHVGSGGRGGGGWCGAWAFSLDWVHCEKDQLVAVEPMLSRSRWPCREPHMPPAILGEITALRFSLLVMFPNRLEVSVRKLTQGLLGMALPCPPLTSQECFLCFAFRSILSCTRREMLQ